MRVWELIKELAELPAGSIVRFVNCDYTQLADIEIVSHDGEGSETVVDLVGHLVPIDDAEFSPAEAPCE